MTTYEGHLRKMITDWDPDTHEVSYTLNLDGEGVLPLNDLVGSHISLTHNGKIACVSCGEKTRKSFGQGYCYTCLQKLAECDLCIMRPADCHFHKGTCRDEAWAQGHCFQQQTLYLARSSAIKVGITRSNQQVHRWMDQGAVEAVVIGHCDNRLEVGLAEKTLSAEMADRTNWSRMLKNLIVDDSFDSYVDRAKELLGDGIEVTESYEFKYPVQTYPEKVSSRRFDKVPTIEGTLLGIKGQYLILDSGVTNIRNQSGYHVSIEV